MDRKIPKMAWFLVSTFARLYVSIEVMSAFLFKGGPGFVGKVVPSVIK